MKVLTALFVALLAFSLASAPDAFAAPLVDAGAGRDASGGYGTSPSVDTELAALPSPEADLGGYVRAVGDAVHSGRWLVVAALLVNLLVFLARRFGVRLVPWLGTKVGGYVLVAGTGLATAIALQLYSGRWSVTVLLEALVLAVSAIGQHQATKDAKGEGR